MALLKSYIITPHYICFIIQSLINLLPLETQLMNKSKVYVASEARLPITIMTDQHQHHDYEEIMMFDIIKITAQL